MNVFSSDLETDSIAIKKLFLENCSEGAMPSIVIAEDDIKHFSLLSTLFESENTAQVDIAIMYDTQYSKLSARKLNDFLNHMNKLLLIIRTGCVDDARNLNFIWRMACYLGCDQFFSIVKQTAESNCFSLLYVMSFANDTFLWKHMPVLTIPNSTIYFEFALRYPECLLTCCKNKWLFPASFFVYVVHEMLVMYDFSKFSTNHILTLNKYLEEVQTQELVDEYACGQVYMKLREQRVQNLYIDARNHVLVDVEMAAIEIENKIRSDQQVDKFLLNACRPHADALLPFMQSPGMVLLDLMHQARIVNFNYDGESETSY